MKSVDEYSISVNSQRGLKEFQYDQVFMEDSTQEKIFEDTNVSLYKIWASIWDYGTYHIGD